MLQLAMLVGSRCAPRKRPSKAALRSSAMVERLEPRRMLSAVNDTLALPANQAGGQINVLANDTGVLAGVWGVTTPQFGMVSYNIIGDVQYHLNPMIKSLADYTAANNGVLTEIAAWGVTEIGNITTYYNAQSAAIGRFGNFLDGWSNGISALEIISKPT